MLCTRDSTHLPRCARRPDPALGVGHAALARPGGRRGLGWPAPFPVPAQHRSGGCCGALSFEREAIARAAGPFAFASDCGRVSPRQSIQMALKYSGRGLLRDLGATDPMHVCEGDPEPGIGRSAPLWRPSSGAATAALLCAKPEGILAAGCKWLQRKGKRPQACAMCRSERTMRGSASTIFCCESCAVFPGVASTACCAGVKFGSAGAG